MSWASDAISTRVDDARRRLAELEASAQDAIDKALERSDDGQRRGGERGRLWCRPRVRRRGSREEREREREEHREREQRARAVRRPCVEAVRVSELVR